MPRWRGVFGVLGARAPCAPPRRAGRRRRRTGRRPPRGRQWPSRSPRGAGLAPGNGARRRGTVTGRPIPGVFSTMLGRRATGFTGRGPPRPGGARGRGATNWTRFKLPRGAWPTGKRRSSVAVRCCGRGPAVGPGGWMSVSRLPPLPRRRVSPRQAATLRGTAQTAWERSSGGRADPRRRSSPTATEARGYFFRFGRRTGQSARDRAREEGLACAQGPTAASLERARRGHPRATRLVAGGAGYGEG